MIEPPFAGKLLIAKWSLFTVCQVRYSRGVNFEAHSESADMNKYDGSIFGYNESRQWHDDTCSVCKSCSTSCSSTKIVFVY